LLPQKTFSGDALGKEVFFGLLHLLDEVLQLAVVAGILTEPLLKTKPNQLLLSRKACPLLRTQLSPRRLRRRIRLGKFL
jgi:hypothetical protein